MTIREENVSYAFLDEYSCLQECINFNARRGAQWVSTSVREGRQRLKFAILSYEDGVGYKYENGICVGRRK